MTKKQIQASSKKKVDAITALCNQMQIVISAEQIITEQGFIKNVVYYTDNEKYDVDENKQPNPKQDENENTTPGVETTNPPGPKKPKK